MAQEERDKLPQVAKAELDRIDALCTRADIDFLPILKDKLFELMKQERQGLFKGPAFSYTNEMRARDASNALEVYAQDKGLVREDLATVASDFLCDLMHLLRESRDSSPMPELLDFHDLAERGARHHHAEIREEAGEDLEACAADAAAEEAFSDPDSTKGEPRWADSLAGGAIQAAVREADESGDAYHLALEWADGSYLSMPLMTVGARWVKLRVPDRFRLDGEPEELYVPQLGVRYASIDWGCGDAWFRAASEPPEAPAERPERGLGWWERLGLFALGYAAGRIQMI